MSRKFNPGSLYAPKREVLNVEGPPSALLMALGSLVPAFWQLLLSFGTCLGLSFSVVIMKNALATIKILSSVSTSTNILCCGYVVLEKILCFSSSFAGKQC